MEVRAQNNDMKKNVRKSQNEIDKNFLDIALIVAKNSTCIAKQVGSVIVSKNKRIIATGYNGTTPGKQHCNEKFECRCPEHKAWSQKYEIHSEVNAILNATIALNDSTLYCTLQPCANCLKTIDAVGIKRVVYLNDWDDTEEWPELINYYSNIKIEKFVSKE